MEQLAKFITDERTGLKYELCGDYYIIAGEDEPEREPIGVWGQRHLNHIQKHCKPFYNKMLGEHTLYDYLLKLDRDAEDTFNRLVKQMAEREDVTEKLKADNQMDWVGKMNNIRQRATEIVNHDIIYNQPKYTRREIFSLCRLFFCLSDTFVIIIVLFVYLCYNIVIFENDKHIGIISDKRNKDGQPYVIHNGGQPNREEDYLSKSAVTGHYRFDAAKIDDGILIKWE